MSIIQYDRPPKEHLKGAFSRAQKLFLGTTYREYKEGGFIPGYFLKKLFSTLLNIPRKIGSYFLFLKSIQNFMGTHFPIL